MKKKLPGIITSQKKRDFTLWKEAAEILKKYKLMEIFKELRKLHGTTRKGSTTQIYTHVTNKQLREVHEAFHSSNK